MKYALLITVIGLAFTVAGCNANKSAPDNNGYEVITSTQQQVANLHGGGNHTEMEYVFQHNRHKIHASCDVADGGNSASSASCGFQPQHTYDCSEQAEIVEAGKTPIMDLRCKDADGHPIVLHIEDEK